MSQVTMPIKKAVIVAAGYGTRFLPATKNQPKEMLPIVDKPIIQYLVEEAIDSGICDIILVTRFGQSVMENHFDSNLELEGMLEKAGKEEELKTIRSIPQLANIAYVRQKKHLPYGNGTPLLSVASLIDDNEPFVFMFGDDLVKSRIPATKQLIDFYNDHKDGIVVAAQEVAKDEAGKYGILTLKENEQYKAQSIVEKPNANELTPPYLAQFGRFILNKNVVNILQKRYEKGILGKGNELYLTDAINEYMQENTVYAVPINGTWFTTGDPLHYMQACVEYTLEREDIGRQFKDYLKTVAK